MSTARSTARPPSSRPTSSAPSALLEAALAYWRELRGRAADFRFHPCLDRRGLRDRSGDGGVFIERQRLTRRTRPIRPARRPSDHLVRAWHETSACRSCSSNCSNNYGPYPLPRKADPAGDPQRARRASRCRSTATGENVRDWLLCRGSCAALLERRGQRAGRARATMSAATPRRTNLALSRRSATCSTQARAEAAGSYARPDLSFVTDRPGHDRRYAIDAAKIEPGLGWAPDGELRQRAAQDGGVVS